MDTDKDSLSAREAELKRGIIDKRWEQAAVVGSIIGTIVSAASLIYLIRTDLARKSEADAEKLARQKIVGRLRVDPKIPLAHQDLQTSTNLSVHQLNEALEKLVGDGLVTVQSDGKHKLATSELLEISTQLQRNSVQLNEQIASIQKDLRRLEEDRNSLMAKSNDIQAEIRSLSAEQNSLRSETNAIAKTIVRQQETLNESTTRNLDALDSDARFASCLNVLSAGAIRDLTVQEMQVIDRAMHGDADLNDLVLLYSTLHKNFPKDFPPPSEDPFESFRTPEMSLVRYFTTVESNKRGQ